MFGTARKKYHNVMRNIVCCTQLTNTTNYSHHYCRVGGCIISLSSIIICCGELIIIVGSMTPASGATSVTEATSTSPRVAPSFAVLVTATIFVTGRSGVSLLSVSALVEFWAAAALGRANALMHPSAGCTAERRAHSILSFNGVDRLLLIRTPYLSGRYDLGV